MAKVQDIFHATTNIKIGNIVEIKDGSWAFGVSIKGEKVCSSGIGLTNRQFKVTYLSQNNYDLIPAKLDNYFDIKIKYNNVILQDVENGDIIFTDSDYLKVIKPVDCPCDRCGKNSEFVNNIITSETFMKNLRKLVFDFIK